MNATTLRQCVSAVLASTLMLALPQFEASAADTSGATASPWDGDEHAAIRLIAGSEAAPNSHQLRAGVELRLAAGWKTYWRYPGDSGVPPEFNFSKSENVKAVTVSWPAPHRFTDEGGTSIGYKGEVLLPVHVVPQNPALPVTLRLTLDYAICGKLCVPAKGTATLELTRADSPHDAALAAAEMLVPKPSRVGDASPLAIRSVARVPGEPQPRVEVAVAAPAAGPLDLFVEGPSPDWALPLPEPRPVGADGLRRFSFALDGLPPGANAAGATLRFTLVSGDKAIEVPAVLD